MLGIEVEGPFVCWPGFEAANEGVSVVMLREACGYEWQSAALAPRLKPLIASSTRRFAVAIAEMDRVARIELVVAFDRVLRSSGTRFACLRCDC